MSANRITRREALAAGVGAVVAGSVVAAPVPKTDPNPSWVGKTVMPKKYAARCKYVINPPTNDGGPLEDWRLLHGASFDVKTEKGTRVEVTDSNGGLVWLEKADVLPLADVVEYFTKALKENGKDTFAVVSRGWAYHQLGKTAQALEDFDAFLKSTPADVAVAAGVPHRWEGLVNRGLVYAEQGEFEKALADLDDVVDDRPASSLASINRGYTYELMGEYDKALWEYSSMGHALAINNTAWILATCPKEKFRDGAAAVKSMREVCVGMDNREGMFLDTLAAAYAEAGKFHDAVKTQEMALEDRSYVVRYGEDGQKRLQLYKDKKPFRTEPLKKK